jgi:hypothetical protein
MQVTSAASSPSPRARPGRGRPAIPSEPPPTAAEVRRLGAVFLAAAALLFALSAWKARGGHWPWQTSAAGIFAALGVLCLGLGAKAGGIHRAWTALGKALGRVVSPAVLAILYFLVVTPFGLLSRLLRRDPLGLKPDPRADTYWREPAVKRTGRARLLRQY